MTDRPMTIRNVTPNTITIKHYEIHALRPKSIAGMSGNVTSLFKKGKGHEGAPRTDLEDVSISVEPFALREVDIKPAQVPNQTLNVYLEIEGEMYQANIMHPTCHSQLLMPLTDNPRFQNTTVYHPEHHHLAVFYRSNIASWMDMLKDETPLSALSIPGTHNSPTHHRALPSVRCQVVPVREQLKQGVRFLDIRVQPENPLQPEKDGLVLVHSVFPISLTGPKYFRKLVNEVIEFLEQNPRETVIMSIKREGTGDSTDDQLSRILKDHYAGDANRWFTAPRIPTLGEARGKIVLIRRFQLMESLKSENDGAGWGINADTWADNSPHSLCPSGDVCIQDFYEVLETENIDKKIQYSVDQLKRAAQCVCPVPLTPETKQPFYINFLTASNFWKVGCWPDRIAAKLNPAIVDYLCTKHNTAGDGCKIEGEGEGAPGDGSTGIVVCDWVGHDDNWDIVNCIVGMNAKYEVDASPG